eukprot:Pgem_evm1s16597
MSPMNFVMDNIEQGNTEENNNEYASVKPKANSKINADTIVEFKDVNEYNSNSIHEYEGINEFEPETSRDVLIASKDLRGDDEDYALPSFEPIDETVHKHDNHLCLEYSEPDNDCEMNEPRDSLSLCKDYVIGKVNVHGNHTTFEYSNEINETNLHNTTFEYSNVDNTYEINETNLHNSENFAVPSDEMVSVH